MVGVPRLARATFTTVFSCTAEGMATGCLPVLGVRVLGGAGHGAMLLSCTASSALAATAVLARFPRALAPDTVIWAGALVQAVALGLAATARPAGAVAGALLAGVGEGPQLAALFAVRHREAPDHLRGQVFTTGASLKIAGFAIGTAVAGPVATRSLPVALALAAAVALLAVLCYAAATAALRRRGPEPAGPGAAIRAPEECPG